MIPDDELNKLMGRVALKVQRDIVQNAPVKTGEFKNSIVVEQAEDGSWIVGSTDPKAEWIELGTDPHVIRPNEKKALYWRGAEHPVKVVHHPGTKPKNLFLNAAAKVEQFYQEELNKL